jgi:diguanylate cyclase (GGDEF)-like protein
MLGLAPGLAFSIIFALLKIGVMGAFWAYMAVCTFYLVLPLKPARIANIILFVTVTVLGYFTLDPAIYARFVVTLFGCSLYMYFCFGEIEHQRHLLKSQSQTDPLTKVLNRSTLNDELSAAISRFKKDGVLSTICTLDLDHFKNINDQYGHDVGDRVLIDFTTTIQSYMGKKDLLFRVGGEEFILLMIGSDASEGGAVAEALRAVIEDTQCLAGIEVTVSAGVSELQQGYSWRLWMKDSDQKLYQAKTTGRNKVIC